MLDLVPGQPVVIDAPDDDRIPPFEVPEELPSHGIFLGTAVTKTPHPDPLTGEHSTELISVARVEVERVTYLLPLNWIRALE